MPPLFDWQCTNCNLEVTRIVSHKEYDVPPTEEEILAVVSKSPTDTTSDCSSPRCTLVQHSWKKIIKGRVMVTRGENWGPGSKGNW